MHKEVKRSGAEWGMGSVLSVDAWVDPGAGEGWDYEHLPSDDEGVCLASAGETGVVEVSWGLTRTTRSTTPPELWAKLARSV